eukprot:NODE_9819_length_624_cov_67.173653_g9551_i0.p1 GENE.NODE_9819_length_624_cov_67.173653_g9551_i0~~NODE_9819_length_624_cov_67.173653_g9551_i0.p1  ORF type:complete len:138 (+),score=13.85 NODE_9819_length_624_cov_67.173653_g9551_i0:1-414(+)
MYSALWYQRRVHGEDIIAFKATQAGDGVLVVHSVITVERQPMGLSVYMEQADRLVGREALWEMLFAMKHGEQIDIYYGSIDGTVAPSSSGQLPLSAAFVPQPIETVRSPAEICIDHCWERNPTCRKTPSYHQLYQTA